MKQARNVIALAALALTLSIPAALRADALDDELAAAKELLLSGKEDQAAQRLDALEARARVTAASSPSDAHVQYILGMAAMYAGHDAPAQRALDQAVRLDPKSAPYVQGRAQLALYQDKPQEAITVLAKFIETDAKNAEVWDLLGEAQANAQQFPAAQESYQKAAALAPREAKYVIKVGDMLARQHKDADAQAAFQKALELDPKSASALGNLAQLYESQKHFDQAVETYARMVALDVTNYRALAKQVQLYQAMGQPKQRDTTRAQIFALKKSGKIDADSYCCEQFTQGQSNIIVLEYFALQGPTAVRYSFNVLSADGKSIEKRITLGSYLDVTALAREQGTIQPGERLFHLDVYSVDAQGDVSNRQTYGMFTKEPTYEETRDLVKQYFAGTLKPVPPMTQAATRPAGVR
jgi:cytochrome c-type biogenesis protein CcmH/NrfG